MSAEIDQYMKACRLCARDCGIDRRIRAGRCGVNHEITAARAALHLWEEPCISGSEGSGAVFFTGCPLGCVYCQNRSISMEHLGKILTENELTDIYLRLQKEGANNINLVTPTQFVPQIIETIKDARQKGLRIPIVYNTGSSEKPETIRLLKETVDIFLPDFKYYDAGVAKRYSNMPSYKTHVVRVIDEMVQITGTPEFDHRGMMQKGTIVRHLVLPGHTKDSMKILELLHERYGNTIYISIMNQYTPMSGIQEQYPELARKVTKREYDRVVDYAISIGIEQAFIQEGDTAKESFIPEFYDSSV